MKTAIVYYSRHHENTKKLLDALSAEYGEITLIDAISEPSPDLRSYDRIGFASGIYYSKFHKSVLKIAEECLPAGKQIFFIYTYGAEKKGYTSAIIDAASSHAPRILGEYGCLGFNTFGPFRLIGGIAKNHPTPNDIQGVIDFYGEL